MDRVIWFTNARFGMFIHWGLYAIPAEGEWIFANRDWKDGEYQSLMKQFNPVDYDPAEWAALAKAAGVLGPSSNILAFQSLGHNWRWEEMDQTKNVLWRVWGDAGTKAGPEHADRLVQDNSLRKSVASYLKNGGRFTEGVLIIFRDELPKLFRELE